MTALQILRLAAEIAIDLVRGGLEGPPRRPAPKHPSRGSWDLPDAPCKGCAHPAYSDCVAGYEHTCGRPHIVSEGARSYSCGGVGSPHPCPACSPNGVWRSKARPPGAR
jgi:hypothetical protein